MGACTYVGMKTEHYLALMEFENYSQMQLCSCKIHTHAYRYIIYVYSYYAQCVEKIA